MSSPLVPHSSPARGGNSEGAPATSKVRTCDKEGVNMVPTYTVCKIIYVYIYPPIRRVRLKGDRALALQSLSFSSALGGGAGVALPGKGERGGPGFMGWSPFLGGVVRSPFLD